MHMHFYLLVFSRWRTARAVEWSRRSQRRESTGTRQRNTHKRSTSETDQQWFEADTEPLVSIPSWVQPECTSMTHHERMDCAAQRGARWQKTANKLQTWSNELLEWTPLDSYKYIHWNIKHSKSTDCNAIHRIAQLTFQRRKTQEQIS